MAAWSRATRWRQGSLLSHEATEHLGLVENSSSALPIAVVATHDCDLAQTSKNEPCIEIVMGRCIEKMDGNFTHAKTARRLHIEFAGVTPCLAEFEASAKVTVAKEALASFHPNANTIMSAENLSTFQYWLASRYRRSAFPDEFERRLKEEGKLDKKIAKIVAPLGALIAGLFFDVDEGREKERIGPDDTYVLDIIVLYPAEPDFLVAAAATESATQELRAAFEEKLLKPTGRWQHIELRFCDAVSESVLTYQQFKQLKRWRLEHLSLGNDPQNPVLSE